MAFWKEPCFLLVGGDHLSDHTGVLWQKHVLSWLCTGGNFDSALFRFRKKSAVSMENRFVSHTFFRDDTAACGMDGVTGDMVAGFRQSIFIGFSGEPVDRNPFLECVDTGNERISCAGHFHFHTGHYLEIHCDFRRGMCPHVTGVAVTVSGKKPEKGNCLCWYSGHCVFEIPDHGRRNLSGHGVQRIRGNLPQTCHKKDQMVADSGVCRNHSRIHLFRKIIKILMKGVRYHSFTMIY